MLNPENNGHLEIDEAGRIKLPPELLARYNIAPGSKIRLSESADGLQIQSPTRLAKLYIEPTSKCNLDCVTCIRNDWDEPQGMMSEEVFNRVAEGLKAFTPAPSIFIGGFGEPLSHPGILNMVAKLKETGATVELITNGTLLTPEISQSLVDIGLDILWVSLDGSTPESYADIRLGAALPQVLKNLENFNTIVYHRYGQDTFHHLFVKTKTKLGIAFVAMKRNIKDLPAIINIGHKYHAHQFMVTNVLPYTKEMTGETLYYRALVENEYRHASLPEIDTNATTYTPMYESLRNLYSNWSGFSTESNRNKCPFIVNGAGAISWSGDFSPCLPLMHNHTSYLGYLQNEERYSRQWIVGNIKEKSLSEIWNAPEHLAFRERVQKFDFAPCTSCGSCEMMAKNEEDCFGNTFPTCGGCLWAQGVIQCP